jgi:hypothetical protein
VRVRTCTELFPRTSRFCAEVCQPGHGHREFRKKAVSRRGQGKRLREAALRPAEYARHHPSLKRRGFLSPHTVEHTVIDGQQCGCHVLSPGEAESEYMTGEVLRRPSGSVNRPISLWRKGTVMRRWGEGCLSRLLFEDSSRSGVVALHAAMKGKNRRRQTYKLRSLRTVSIANYGPQIGPALLLRGNARNGRKVVLRNIPPQPKRTAL